MVRKRAFTTIIAGALVVTCIIAGRAQTGPKPQASPATKDRSAIEALAVWMSTGPETAEEQVSWDKYKNMTFVADSTLQVREKPSAAAPIVWTMAPLQIAGVFDVTQGWLKLGSGKKRGWVPIANETAFRKLIAPGGLQAIARKVSDLDAAWTVTVRHAILTGHPAIGFSEKQVALALGRPLKTTEEETATGVRTIMVYVDRVIEINGGQVTKITTIR